MSLDHQLIAATVYVCIYICVCVCVCEVFNINDTVYIDLLFLNSVDIVNGGW